MAAVRWGTASHEGRLRAQNEDHAHAGPGLFIVADGMGGHLAGEVASEMAVTTLRTQLGDGTNTLDDVVAAVHDANVDIYRGSIEDPDQAGMGTTVTAIAVVADPHDGEVLGVVNVGDSRGYVLRHGRLRQVTVDHSFVQELVAEGAITRDEARTHPRRNIVTRALGIEPVVRVDSWIMPIIRGDRFLLCSDGLVDEVTDDTIAQILTEHLTDPERAAQALVEAANEAGGRDNITVVIVDVIEGDAPPDPTEELDLIPTWSDDEQDTTGEGEIISDPPDDELRGAAVGLYDGGDDVPLVPGAAAPNTDPAGPDEPVGNQRRGGRLGRFLIGVGIAAVLVAGFAILAAWARDGYFVAFDDGGQVVIYQGRNSDVLWFDPTPEAVGPYTRDELDDESVELVEDEPEFSSRASAELFVAERLETTTTTSTTTTTTTTIPETTG